MNVDPYERFTPDEIVAMHRRYSLFTRPDPSEVRTLRLLATIRALQDALMDVRCRVALYGWVRLPDASLSALEALLLSSAPLEEQK